VSSRELAADAVQSVQRLVSLEIALAKQELREIATTNLIAGACIAAAGFFAILALFVAVPVLVRRRRPLALAGGSGLGGRICGDREWARPLRQISAEPAAADQDTRKPQGEQGMGASSAEIDQEIKDTRRELDEKLGILERRAASGARRVRARGRSRRGGRRGCRPWGRHLPTPS